MSSDFLCFSFVNHLWDYNNNANFESLKFILVLEAEANKAREVNYSSVNQNAIQFVLFPSSRKTSMNFILMIPKLAHGNMQLHQRF